MGKDTELGTSECPLNVLAIDVHDHIIAALRHCGSCLCGPFRCQWFSRGSEEGIYRLLASTEMGWGKIVNPTDYVRVKGLLDRTNGTIITGGEVDGDQRVASTLVANVQPDDSMMEESAEFVLLHRPVSLICGIKGSCMPAYRTVQCWFQATTHPPSRPPKPHRSPRFIHH